MDGTFDQSKYDEANAIIEQIKKEAEIAREAARYFCTKQRLITAIEGNTFKEHDYPFSFKACLLNFFGGSIRAYISTDIIEDRALLFPKEDPRYTITYL